jgi:hypothetical protein
MNKKNVFIQFAYFFITSIYGLIINWNKFTHECTFARVGYRSYHLR